MDSLSPATDQRYHLARHIAATQVSFLVPHVAGASASQRRRDTYLRLSRILHLWGVLFLQCRNIIHKPSVLMRGSGRAAYTSSSNNSLSVTRPRSLSAGRGFFKSNGASSQPVYKDVKDIHRSGPSIGGRKRWICADVYREEGVSSPIVKLYMCIC